MSVEMLQTSSLVCFIVAGLFLIAAIVLFFLLDVPALVGELTGATERKAIESIRMQNEETVIDKGAKPKKTKKVAKTSMQSQVGRAQNRSETAKLSTAKLQSGSENTTVLNCGDDATTVLYSGGNNNETTVLAQPEDVTTLLNQNMQTASVTLAPTASTTVPVRAAAGFTVEVAFEYTSSSEIIEQYIEEIFGKQAFCGCKKLKNITVKTKKLTTKKVGSKAFSKIHSKATIKVPKSKYKSYKTLFKKDGAGKKVKYKKF